MESVPTTRYARSGDVHIAYQLSGEGPIDVLLVPDGVIPIEAIPEEPSFDLFVRRLGRFSRVIRFDRRGMGLSDPVTASNPPTLEQWMGDAEAVLDEVGSDRTALLGMAEGGFVVAMLAATRPARVGALVLVHATPGWTAEPFARGKAAEVLERFDASVDEGWGDLEWAIPWFAPSASHDGRYRQWLQRAVRHSLSPAMARAVFDVMFRSDIRDILPAIGVPTLVIHRRDNRYLEAEHGRYLSEHIPGARYVEVEGIDHVPYLGDQGPILEAIEEFLTGSRGGGAADRILATVLFTDIVRSTEKAAEIGDSRWRELLLDHHELGRREVQRFGGRLVDTTGDGMFAAFDGPAKAVRCACSMVEAVRRLGMEIRAGLHTGECEVLGDNLGGIAVHIGARITSLSGPGEVLVSSTLKDLVAGSGIRFADRGARRLKGVPDEWRLFGVDLASATT
jgi:pimeloyl-ACP methyl ester carboxylesterase/class 3 adenylate cyclase